MTQVPSREMKEETESHAVVQAFGILTLWVDAVELSG